MKIDSVKNQIFVNQNPQNDFLAGSLHGVSNAINPYQLNSNSVSFRGNADFSKRLWMYFRNLSEYMKEPSEMVSAIIQAIGTSIVAPIAILSSPNRHVHNKDDEAKAKEKKRFQAFRQPFSAIIALLGQVPAVVAIKKSFDHFAYVKPAKIFGDETLGTLIPDKKFLAKQAKKALKENADSKLLEEWKSELEYARNTEKVKEDLIKDIRSKYGELGITLSDEKLQKIASEKKRVRNFVADKMASAKHDVLINAKVEELKGMNFVISDADLITEEYKELARHRFKDEFKTLKDNSLSWFDKCIKTMGLSSGKIRQYNKDEKELATRRGLELLKGDNPKVFNDPATKFIQFIKNRDEHATKIYKNKVFWIQLIANLGIVAASCTILNWMHPKFMDFFEGMKQAKKEEEERKAARNNVVNNAFENRFTDSDDPKKVEVRA